MSRLTKASNGFDGFSSRKRENHVGKSIEILEKKPRKRFRQPSWQRRKRCKRIVLEGSSTTVPSVENFSVKNDLNKTHEHDFTRDQWSGKGGTTSNKNGCNRQVDIQLLCPCCSVFRSLSSLPMDAQINRRPIFYNMKHSPSLFLEKRILFSLF
ncbi:hypothetical protein KSS87_022473 [Heliosperma pusillum]|nr:hypothetical protein KSS87_022473 [Heliosperma pusillum]